MAVLSPMCRVTPIEQMGCGLSALGCAVKGSPRLFQVKVSKASQTAKRVSIHNKCARIFSFQRKAACSVMNLRYLKEDSRDVELMTGKKGMNKKDMGKVL